MSKKVTLKQLYFNISNRLDEQMREKGYDNHAELAKKIGITRVILRKYIYGQSVPGAENLCKIAKFFGVTCDYLLGGENATNHKTSDICKKTGLSQKAIEKLMQYRKGKNQNDKKVIAAINRMLESDCEDFLLTFYNSISFYDLTLEDFDGESIYWILYTKNYSVEIPTTFYKPQKQPIIDSLSYYDILRYSVVSKFNSLLDTITNDKTAKKKHIDVIKNSLIDEYNFAKFDEKYSVIDSTE